jgi:putative flippase GtrA
VRWRHRFARYAGVSFIATVLAQAGLAFAYAVMRWPVVSAVMFSLAVSVGPAYLMSKRFVWPDTTGSRAAAGEATGFFVIAAIGAATTVAIVWLAVRVAGAGTSDHMTLAFVANVASVAATGLVWAARYVVLDRVLFSKRPSQRPVDSSVSI